MRWILLMSMACAFWAGAFIAGKIGLRTATPMTLTYTRFVLAVGCLYLYARFKGISLRIGRGDVGNLLLLGLTGMVGYHLLFFQALKHTTAIKTAMIGATNPLMAAALAALFLGERLDGGRILLMLAALAGVLLTISNWHLGLLVRQGPGLGDLFMGGAVVCWSVYSVLVRRMVRRFDPIVTTFYSFLTCVVVLTPLQGVEIARHGLAVDAPGWLAIVYMGVFPTFIGYLLQQQAIKHLGVSKAALFINLVPVMVMVLAVVVLGETFLPLNLVSAAMIIASVLGFSLMAGTAGSAPRPAAAPAAPSALPPPPAPGARP
ncbi:MAG: DMT family transporter [Holophaga sp.]|jgi:drug/metabolite transporter (DMT)-like permease